MLKKFLPIGVILVLVIIASAFYFGAPSVNPQAHTVILTQNGFSPEEISINKGDNVIFTTNRNQPFWPASNLHPTHGIYPEFDPKHPIEPTKSWIFKFDKKGLWKYHDHLAPLYRGVINVQDKKTHSQIEKFNSSLRQLTDRTINFETASRSSGCENVSGSEKLQCWERMIDLTLKDKGLSGAFETMATFYKNEPQFAASCHDFAHKLGAKAYRLFSQKKDFGLSDKSSYCGYGFYHGFMETLLQTEKDMDTARKFCEYADSQLKITTADALGACYHGIGHGAVEDVTDPKLFGKPQAIIQPSLDLCEKVSDTDDKLFRCISGVFNALEIVTSSGRYNLSLNKEDPLWICRKQPDRYKRPCYTQMVVAVMHVTSNDFEKSAQILNTIPEDDLAKESLSGLVVELVNQGKTDYKTTIDFCRKLPDRFHLPCITGFAEGFLKYGPPRNEYIKAVDFCSSSLLTDTEKKACFNRILSILRIWYTPEKSQEICEGVDQKYRWNNCQY